MNTFKIALGKNLTLLGVLAVSLLNVFYRWMSWKELLGIQAVFGLLYIFLSCYEYLSTSYKASLPVRRYPYFTYSFMMFRAMKTSLFLSFAILLATAGPPLRTLYPICLIIAATEGTITFLRYRKQLCFVNIYANYLLIVQNQHLKLFAADISLVEFRHDILYFVKKNGKTQTIKLENIEAKAVFLRDIYQWISRNQVILSRESRESIEEKITLF